MTFSRTHRVIATVAGCVLGLVVGAVIAVNLVIYAGIDRGYEATPGEVFAENPIVGILAVGSLVIGPFLGGYLVWRSTGR